ncbi:PAS domain S-box protein [Nocardioides sp. zg-579]|uniref:Sensor-like histidine kinase SenX3 n=1 Tax=Nocardioides marmotae TaxID=2663857 RepID=A0A6I3JGG3_9ACTN|nr:PAS domain-containing sensor histidine kinase [Nocardioides marmotae]MCR6033376.1 PAS domain S-box protein [Gordonia jinghuaiqii]MTB97033.1 PAS domain S-box protein [Nocardioides marmotae]QKE00696.1 PAS domain S-box protein [Nocardioides marmotae]
MRLDPAVRASGLLAVLVASGILAVHSAPADGSVIGIWPVGVASALAIEAGRRRAPYVVPVVLVVAVLTIWQGGRPFDVALGYGIGIAVETAVVAAVLLRGRAGRPPLRTDADLRRYFLACGAAGGVGAAAGALTSWATGFGEPAAVALALGAAHTASQLTLLPFFMRLPQHGSIASPVERAAQWGASLVLTPLVFYPDQLPSMAFMVVPLLAWGALRLRPLEALAQMAATLFFAIVMTSSGRGPFAAVPQAFDLSPDTRGVLLAAYAATCALIVVPLMIRVGQHIVISREARSQRDKVQSIVDGATGIAIIGTDPEGRVTLFNPGAERLLGYSAAEMMGRSARVLHTMRSVVDKADELGTTRNYGSVVREIARPEHAGTQMRFLRQDGVERVHSMTLNRMVDDLGTIVGYVSTSEDVTDQLRAQDRLQDSLHTERQAVEQLRELDRAKDAFVSSVSHELRTPITSILGYLELLADGSYGALSPPQATALQRVSANSDRLLSLIDELLTLSRLSEDGLALSSRAFDLREVVQEGYGVVAPAWEHRRLDVSLGLPSEPVLFVGDRDMLERVVVNLLGNAVKFTPEGGSVEVCLEVADRGVAGPEIHLDVRDTGMGIPTHEIQQLFSRFFRSSLAQERAIPGSGLGLSITRAIIEKHGGVIDVESVVDRGTLFRVRLPA